ncbi:hypothetical protein [Sphingomonas sp. PAMC 26617]|uniref:hypothetical protein n=1 Tax=Sphingomonas sp. PAMC 26617 TaxID=1112216 RepID=UPI0002899461|nr:hypothetical protein [Sphingomonas sp. PAMC 26617]
MRLPVLASFLLLLAPATGGGTAGPQDIPAQVSGAAAHRMCGDDVIAPGVARLMPGFGSGALIVTTAQPKA